MSGGKSSTEAAWVFISKLLIVWFFENNLYKSIIPAWLQLYDQLPSLELIGSLQTGCFPIAGKNNLAFGSEKQLATIGGRFCFVGP